MTTSTRRRLALRAAWHILSGRPFVLALREGADVVVDVAMEQPHHLDTVAACVGGHAELVRCHAHADTLLQAVGVTVSPCSS